MPAGIDITAGVASYVDSRTDAWHALGQSVNGAFTAEEAMTLGHLGGWDVRKAGIKVDLPGRDLYVPGRVAIIRNNPIVRGQVDVIGDVGADYEIIQNEQHADLLNALIDEGGAHFETAGALWGGKQVFITMKLPGHVKIAGVDPVETYIVAVNSHDGSRALTFMVTMVRVVCANTLQMAFNNHSHIFRVRHTSGAQKALVGEARRALDFTFGYVDDFKETANLLSEKEMTQIQFEEIIAKEFGAPEDAPKAAVTRATKRLDAMAELFTEAGTQESVRGTAWAGLNALTEWFDHQSPVRGDDPDTSRAMKAIFDNSFKNRALELMLAAK